VAPWRSLWPGIAVTRTGLAAPTGQPLGASGLTRACSPAFLTRGGEWRIDLQDDGRNRHKSMDTLRSYVRDAELFRDHAGAGLS
jgi:hypothetical protein